MALRRKNKRTEQSKLDATPPWDTRIREEPEATAGPYDERDQPDDELTRLDLGALRVPVTGELEVRLEVTEQQQVQGVTLAGPQSSMQLGAFAAPRNEGIWGEVRSELADSLREQKGNPREVEDGPFGAELHGTLAGSGGRVPVRFVGVDGPRWFLRAMILGPAATDDAEAEPFLAALRETVVVRGTTPAPAREPIPLTMPTDVLPGGAATDDDADGDQD